MTEDPKLAVDEANRLDLHREVKEQAAEEVKSEIERQDLGDQRTARDAAAIAQRMRRQAVTEIEETETEIQRGRKASRIAQVVDFVFWIIYSLIALEIILELIGARETNPFRSFVKAVTMPFLAPFYALVPDPGSGRFQFRVSYVVALVVYILLHLAIGKLLRLSTNKTAI